MRLHITDRLVFDTSLTLEEQAQEVQEHINNIAFDYAGANADFSIWQGDDTPGQPIRFEKLVHDIATQEGSTIRTTVDWRYHHPYGHPAAFSGTHALRLEVLHG